jgi:trehalose 2-sulfotransferase
MRGSATAGAAISSDPGRLPATSVIIAATHRSGSFHFADMLASTSGIPLADEYLNFGLLRTRAQLGLAPTAGEAAVLAALLATKRGESPVFSLKTMWGAFCVTFQAIANTLPPAPDNAWQLLPARLLDNPRYLWVRRRDKIRQAVSFYRATLTGTWRSEQSLPPPTGGEPAALPYSGLAIARLLTEIERDEAAWAAFFAETGVPVMEIVYEDFITDRLTALQAVGAFLGWPPLGDQLPAARFQRVSDGLNQQWSQRFIGQLPLMRAADATAPQWLASDEKLELELLDDGGTDPWPAGSCRALTIGIHHRGTTPWRGAAARAGTAWLQLELQLSDAAGRTVRSLQTVDTALEPGSQCTVQCRIEVPPTAANGRGQLQITALQTGGHRWAETSIAHAPDIAADPAFSGFCRYFPGWQDTELPEWKTVPGLGSLSVAKFPYIFHPEHGWWYVDVASSQPGRLMVRDKAMGWLWIDLQQYPRWVMRMRDKQALEFRPGADGRRSWHPVDGG